MSEWQSLKSWQRRALQLLRARKLDTQDIATALGRTEAEVYNALHMARDVQRNSHRAIARKLIRRRA